MADSDKSIDALGIKPVGESIKIATQGAVDGAAAFLGRICLPAAEELGLLFRDKVHAWRTANVISVAAIAEKMIGDAEVHAHPRMVSRIIDEAAWIDDHHLQGMWAGLLASSCTDSGDDDSNLLFLNLLSDLTGLQARLLDYFVENATKAATQLGLPFAENLNIDIPTLITIGECDELVRIDREVDHLRGLELIHGGFDTYGTSSNADVTPSAIALNMYVRCHGSRQSPTDYFNLEVAPTLVETETEQ